MIQPLVGKQRQSIALALEERPATLVWEGSVRSSKTIVSLLWWIHYVRHGPPGNLVMIGKTERTLKRNIIDVLVDMLGEKRCRPNYGDGELMMLGRRIYLAGANDAKAEDKIRGLTLAGGYGDEATLYTESFMAMLLSRLSVEGAQLGLTCNPDNPNHYLMRDYLRRAGVWLKHDGTIARDPDGLNLARFSFRLRDNPSLPESYVTGLEQMFTGLWRKRYIDGLWVLAEGAIYDTFDPEPGNGHVVRHLPRIVEWCVSIDYGTSNPFVALLLGLGEDDRIYVAREWRWDSRKMGRQLTDVEYSEKLRTWLDHLDRSNECPGAADPEWIVYDPSAASFGAQLHRDNWSGVKAANNAVEDGLRVVSSLMSAKRWAIHESCGTGHHSVGGSDNGLIDEKSGYVWDPEAAKRGKEQPLKVDDHGPDAERYGARATRLWWRDWIGEAAPVDEDDLAA